MFDYMINRFEHRLVAILYQASPAEIVRAELCQHRIRFGHRSLEVRDQVGAGRSTTRGEFPSTIAFDVLFTNSANDPLPDVAGKMQQKITDAVR